MHCGEHCVDWEGLIPTHDITRYPAAATVCFNKVTLLKHTFVYVAQTRGSLAKEMCLAHGTTSIRHLLGVCFNKVCGVRIVVIPEPSKLMLRVRFSYPAPEKL
jgi:hypothetical protein